MTKKQNTLLNAYTDKQCFNKACYFMYSDDTTSFAPHFLFNLVVEGQQVAHEI